MKILILLLIFSLQSLYASPSSSVSNLKQREKILLEKWHQQQRQISQVLRRLRKTHPHPCRFAPSSSQNIKIKDLVHQNLAIRSLEAILKKQQDQIIKLCKDITQVRSSFKNVP